MDFNFDTGTISNLSELSVGTSNLTITGSAGVVMPIGGTLLRAPSQGVMRFNTDLGRFEGFDGTVWTQVQTVTNNSSALTNLATLSGTGLIVQTSTGTYAARAVAGTSNNIVVTNGDGIAGNPTINLAAVGVSGTYSQVVTDSYGRVVSGSASQDWSTISGTPTTIAGYGITDALGTAGVTALAAGVIASRPTAGHIGHIYISTDTNAVYYDNGTSWTLIDPAMTGDVTKTAGGTITTLATVNSNVGTYGSATSVPVLTVDAKGRVTAVSTASISSAITLSGDVTGTGVTGGTTLTSLATVNGNVGTFGSASNVGVFTVNGKGLITAASNVAIPNSVTISGDATGAGTTSTTTSITLANVNATTGSFGSNSSVATFTVNAKGLVTAAANVSITPASIGAINTNQLGVAGGVAQLGADGKLADSQVPAALVGALVYQGTWNASTNTPTLASSVGTKGQYYKVSVAGTTTIDGYNKWAVGDIIAFNGTTWDAIDGLTTEVTSVFGRVGAVTATLASSDFANQGTATTVLHGNASGNPTWSAINLATDVTGTLPTTSFPAITGDVTKPAGSSVSTLATVNTNVGSFGSTTSVPVVTVNAKGLVTAVTSATIPNTIALTGDGTASVTTGGSGALTLATVNATTGTFGSGTSVAQVTVNNKGLVTTVSNVTIPNTIALTGDGTASVTTGGSGALTLATVNANVGSFGTATAIPVVTVNAKGLVTAMSTVSISGNISVTGGDLTMSGATGSAITNATLATVNSTTGVFGSASKVPVITVNGKGLVTSVANVSITASGIGAVSNDGTTPSIQSGTYAAMPPAATAGRLYVTTDTSMIWRDSGTAWVQVSEASFLYTENASTPVTSTVTGANAVSIGSGNTVTSTFGVVTGSGAKTAIYGGQINANGSFTSAGDAQTGKYVLRNITTTATTTELFLDGASAQMVLPNNSALTYQILLVAKSTNATGNYGAWKIEGLVKRDATASTTALVGTRSKTVLTRPSGWDADVSVNTTTGAFIINVTGATSNTIRWVATVTTSEVTN